MNQNLQNFHQEPQEWVQSSSNQLQNINQQTQNENIQQLPEEMGQPQNVRILARAYYQYPILSFRLRNKLFLLFLINFILGVSCSIEILTQKNVIICVIIQSLILLEYIFLAWSYFRAKDDIWGNNSVKLNIFLVRSYILVILNLTSLIWQVEHVLQTLRIISSIVFCLFYQFALIEYNK